jgi:hypothetical protein
MSMMMRRSAAGQGQHQEHAGLDTAGDPRFPEVAGATATIMPAAEVRARLDGLAGQRFSGYLQLGQSARAGGTQGVILLHAGHPINARAAGTEGGTALAQLLPPPGAPDVLCATHALSEGATLALASTVRPPELTQPMGGDGGEVAVLLRDLASVRHSGTVQISAFGARTAAPVWVRILMHEGKFLGVYSGGDRQLKASLADVGGVLSESAPQMTLFSIQGIPPTLPLPTNAPTAPARSVTGALPGATPERDELLETDLVWFMSRFERAFGRLKERREPQADLLRAFGELTNELAGFVAALQSGTATPAAAHGVVAAELTRARAAGIVSADLKLGKAGLDAVAVAKSYGAFPRRSPAAATYFATASADILTLIGRLMERMLSAFHDPTAAGFAREGCETLLREIRTGLVELTQH